MDPDRPAPGRLEVVRHLLNSDDRFHHVDHADDLESLNRYLARLEPRRAMGGPQDLARFRAFREATRALLLMPTPTTRSTFNEIAARYPMTVWVDEKSRPGLRCATPEQLAALDRLVGEALTAVHEAMLTGQWSRLRACRRFDCSWIYYDATPGRSMRWCSTDPCGNVMKTRAYRARQAAGAATAQ